MSEEKAEAQGGEEEAVKKKDEGEKGSGVNPKLIYGILGLNTIVIGAVAFSIFLYVKKQQNASSLSKIAESPTVEEHGGGHGDPHGGGHDAHDPHGGGGAKKDAPEAPKNFVKQSFTVNLASGSHYAKVDVDMEVEDDLVRDELTRIEPKVRDFINVVLSSKTYEQIESVEGRQFLAEEIKNKINGYLSKGQVKNVYFPSFIIQ